MWASSKGVNSPNAAPSLKRIPLHLSEVTFIDYKQPFQKSKWSPSWYRLKMESIMKTQILISSSQSHSINSVWLKPGCSSLSMPNHVILYPLYMYTPFTAWEESSTIQMRSVLFRPSCLLLYMKLTAYTIPQVLHCDVILLSYVTCTFNLPISHASKTSRYANLSWSSTTWHSKWNFWVHSPASQLSSHWAFKCRVRSFIWLHSSPLRTSFVISLFLYPVKSLYSLEYIECSPFIGSCSTCPVARSINLPVKGKTMPRVQCSIYPALRSDHW